MLSTSLLWEGCWLISTLLNFPRLQELIIEKGCIGDEGLFIYCPRLLSFRLAWHFIEPRLVVLWQLLSLVNATILADDKSEIQHLSRYHDYGIDFIKGLTYAKTLKIISPRLVVCLFIVILSFMHTQLFQILSYSAPFVYFGFFFIKLANTFLVLSFEYIFDLTSTCELWCWKVVTIWYAFYARFTCLQLYITIIH